MKTFTLPEFNVPVGVETMENQQKHAMLAVKDMPSPLANAARELGHGDEEQMTLRQAMKCYTQWELGDPYWASNILDLQDEFSAELRNRFLSSLRGETP